MFSLPSFMGNSGQLGTECILRQICFAVMNAEPNSLAFLLSLFSKYCNFFGSLATSTTSSANRSIWSISGSRCLPALRLFRFLFFLVFQREWFRCANGIVKLQWCERPLVPLGGRRRLWSTALCCIESKAFSKSTKSKQNGALYSLRLSISYVRANMWSIGENRFRKPASCRLLFPSRVDSILL